MVVMYCSVSFSKAIKKGLEWLNLALWIGYFSKKTHKLLKCSLILSVFYFCCYEDQTVHLSKQRQKSESVFSTICCDTSFQNLVVWGHCQNKSTIVSGYISHNEQLTHMSFLNLRTYWLAGWYLCMILKDTSLTLLVRRYLNGKLQIFKLSKKLDNM